MDKLLETYNFPRMNCKGIQSMIRPMSSNKIESVIKKLPRNKNSGPDDFTEKFYQTFKEELTSVLLKIFQEIEKEGMLLYSFYETSITMIPKSKKDTTEKRKEKKITGQYQ